MRRSRWLGVNQEDVFRLVGRRPSTEFMHDNIFLKPSLRQLLRHYRVSQPERPCSQPAAELCVDTRFRTRFPGPHRLPSSSSRGQAVRNHNFLNIDTRPSTMGHIPARQVRWIYIMTPRVRDRGPEGSENQDSINNVVQESM